MLKAFVVIALLVTAGLLIEKALHIDYDITGLTLALKQDISKFVKALFSKPIERHCFDVTLSNDIKTIAESYSKKGFDIQLANRLFRNVPVVAIRFVPDRTLSQAEILELIQLLLIKFREYLDFYNLNWKHFATYTVSNEYVTICIHYAELECDILPFINQYRLTVRQKTSKNSGILRDEELEAELRHVN